MPRLQDIFKKNQPAEQPTYTYPSGDKYTGQWLNGRKHGCGVAEFVSGNRYEGEWDNDFKHGKGTITFVDGTTYVGDWSKDHKHGFGEARFASGNRYEGQWVDDAMEGTGTFYYARGDVYTGEWKRGKICGFGTWVSFDRSSRYEGGWQDGLRHGRGKLTENGKELEVEYRMGHRCDEAYFEELQAKEAAQKALEDSRHQKQPLDQSTSLHAEHAPRIPSQNLDDVGRSPNHASEAEAAETPPKVRKKKKKDKQRPVDQAEDRPEEPVEALPAPEPQKRKKNRRKDDLLRNNDDELPHHALGNEDEMGSSPSFLPLIPKQASMQSTSLYRSNLPVASQPSSFLAPLSPALVGALPAVPRTRLPPLPGAPRAPPMERDAAYRRKQSGSSRKEGAASRKSTNPGGGMYLEPQEQVSSA